MTKLTIDKPPVIEPVQAKVFKYHDPALAAAEKLRGKVTEVKFNNLRIKSR